MIAAEDTNLRVHYDPEAKHMQLRQSALQAFLDCRRRFYWEYAVGLEVDYPERQRPWTTATTGTAVHLGIETYYGTDDDPEQAILDWATETFPGWQNDEKAAKGVRLAVAMILGHIEDVERDGVDVGEETIAIEHSLAVDVRVGDWTVTLTGQIDRVVRDRDGLLVIEDTKTTDRLDSTLQYIQQLGRYAVLYRIDTGERVDRVRSNQIKRVLRNGQGPFYARPYVPLNEDAYDAHWTSLINSLSDLLRCFTEERWYERVSKDCDWKCGVRDLCIAQQHGDDIEMMVDLHYRLKGSNNNGTGGS